MAGPVLYSANCWIAHQFATQYRKGIHFVWCSEYYDPAMAPIGTAAAAIAPSSSPKGIYSQLADDCSREDTHSALIRGYRRTFRRLAKDWLASNEITKEHHDEIVATVTSRSWKIWRPVLFVIPREAVKHKIVEVPHGKRAAYGPELQIPNLEAHEFDMIER